MTAPARTAQRRLVESAVPSHAGATRVLLALGVAAGPLFVATVLVQGALRRGYDPSRHPISSLALGEGGWIQSALFVTTGLLVAGFAVGVWRTWRPRTGAVWAAVLLGLNGLSLVGAGFFDTHAVLRYPPGTPDQPLFLTLEGTLHNAILTCGFIAMMVAFTLVTMDAHARRRRAWAWWSAGSGIVFAALFGLAILGFRQHGALEEVGGLLQRAAIAVGFAWLTTFALHVLRLGGATGTQTHPGPAPFSTQRPEP